MFIIIVGALNSSRKDRYKLNKKRSRYRVLQEKTDERREKNLSYKQTPGLQGALRNLYLQRQTDVLCKGCKGPGLPTGVRLTRSRSNQSRISVLTNTEGLTDFRKPKSEKAVRKGKYRKKHQKE